MIKLLISLAIATTFAVTNAPYANTCGIQLEEAIEPSDIVIVTEKVKDVIYEEGWFYLVTHNDKEDGYWVLDVIPWNGESPSKFSHTIEKLKMEYIGKIVDVQYYGDFELLSWYVSE